MEKTFRFGAASLAALLLSACGGNSPDSQLTSGGSSASRANAEPEYVALQDSERLATGLGFTAGLHADGQVYTWGNNSYGQLGNGTLTGSPVPLPVEGLSNVRSLSAGAFHVVAALQDGTVSAWGSNHYGQLGMRKGAGRTVPGLVVGMSAVKAVSANVFNNLALTRDGGVWGWGRMAGVTTPVPTPVEGLSGSVAVSAGQEFGLALKDGQVWAWGSNLSYELGLPKRVSYSYAPVRLDGLDDVRAISAGYNHALALRADGSVWGWGSNVYGQLGNHNGHQPGRIDGLPASNGSTTIKMIVAAPYNSAVLYSDGSVWAWGRNVYRHIDQTGNTVRKPARVMIPGTAVALAVSGSSILVLNKDGTVYGIGGNSDGQLGNNTTSATNVPVQATGVGGRGYLDLGKSASN